MPFLTMFHVTSQDFKWTKTPFINYLAFLLFPASLLIYALQRVQSEHFAS